MTEPDTTPDPVLETAPVAPPPPDDTPRDDDVDAERGAVFPVAGTVAGTVPAPPPPGRPA